MDGLEFVTASPPAVIHPARADVACFVGFVAQRPPRAGRAASDWVELADVPIPIESWEAFDALIDWQNRPIDAAPGTPKCDTALGAAVRSFFAQGGRFCYVVLLGDPWAVRATPAVRRAYASAYLPAFPPVSPADPASWRGIGHLFGLPEVSVLCLPDLPDLFSVAPPSREPFVPADGPEEFVECAARIPPAEQRFLRGVSPPRCDEDGFRAWRECIVRIGQFLASPAHRLREIQFVAAVPLPVDTVSLASQHNTADRVHRAANAQWREVAAIQTAFVQLVYPWLGTRDSGLLPGNLLAPDGWFAGLLARSALERGSWHSLNHHPARAVTMVEPVLDRATLERPLEDEARRVPPRGGRTPTVREHVTIIGPTAEGMLVLSDVTTDDDPIYRPASVNRLVVAILRAARIGGDDLVFANNGEVLWRRLRERLENLLAGLWSEGALLGPSALAAFEVRCDRSTMTQDDIDAGRLIARLVFTASVPIVRITVVLVMDDAGQVNVATSVAANNPDAA